MSADRLAFEQTNTSAFSSLITPDGQAIFRQGLDVDIAAVANLVRPARLRRAAWDPEMLGAA